MEHEEIKAEMFGEIRENLFLQDGKRFPNKPQDKRREIFVSFELEGVHRSGWLTRNELTERMTAGLIQENPGGQSIYFRQAKNGVRCIAKDGVGISSRAYHMELAEVHLLLEQIKPAERDHEPHREAGKRRRNH